MKKKFEDCVILNPDGSVACYAFEDLGCDTYEQAHYYLSHTLDYGDELATKVLAEMPRKPFGSG
jgi:hypothetical protein